MSDNASIFQQVTVLGVEGLGVGALLDAQEFGSRGANTLANIATYVGGLETPVLEWLGLGNLTSVRGLQPADPPAASHGRLAHDGTELDPASALQALVGQVVEGLQQLDQPVTMIGRAATLLGVESDDDAATATVDDIVESTFDAMSKVRQGLIVSVLPLTNDAPGGPVSVGRRFARLDAAVSRLLDNIADKDNAIVFVVGVGAADPTAFNAASGTREYAPVLAYSPAVPSGVDLGTRVALADVGATVGEILGVDVRRGSSFFANLVA